jgi:site-specific DNA-methyltransferase (adenine-specific)
MAPRRRSARLPARWSAAAATEKPADLLAYFIAKHCSPGGMVLDPVGSGSTLLAAQRLGRRAIGVEIDQRYCQVTVTRLWHDRLEAPEQRHSQAAR